MSFPSSCKVAANARCAIYRRHRHSEIYPGLARVAMGRRVPQESEPPQLRFTTRSWLLGRVCRFCIYELSQKKKNWWCLRTFMYWYAMDMSFEACSKPRCIQCQRNLTHSSSPIVWFEDCRFFYDHLRNRGYPAKAMSSLLASWNQSEPARNEGEGEYSPTNTANAFSPSQTRKAYTRDFKDSSCILYLAGLLEDGAWRDIFLHAPTLQSGPGAQCIGSIVWRWLIAI